MNSVSSQIRERRLALDLSLRDLARRTDTSAATLSRYENGWNRFEVRTLAKIAGALACNLDVRLVPITPTSPRPSVRDVVRRIRRLFWDSKLCAANLSHHSQWVLERVLEYGDIGDVRILMGFMGRTSFLEGVSRARLGSPRTANFWMRILEKEGYKCTRKFSRSTAWNC